MPLLDGLFTPATSTDTTSCWAGHGNDVCHIVHAITGNATAANVADWLVAKPLTILGVLVVGVVLRWLCFRVIDRITRQAAEGTVPAVLQRSRVHQRIIEANAVAVERRQQRSAAMGGLLKSVTTGVIGAIVLVMVIAQLGYNIGPLLASAGILGVALGFGAQSLVSDFLSGIFMILEDQYGVGDVVDVGQASGTVEAVGLRVTRVRDVNGTVWYVRNGQITRVGNSSQNWARTVLDVPVAYHENLDRIRTILRDVAHDVYEHPDYHRLILEEPEVWGVERWDPDGVVMRVVLKTAPLQQWTVAREMRERVKDRFDELGIEIPLPQRVVWHRADVSASESGAEREVPTVQDKSAGSDTDAAPEGVAGDAAKIEP